MKYESGLPWFGFWLFLIALYVFDEPFIIQDTENQKELLLLEIEETQLKIELLRKQCND